MNIVKRRKFKWRYALVGVLAFYIVLCQSCMTMRMNSKETANYFDTLRVPYSSRTSIVGERKIHFIQTGNLDKPTLFFVHGSPGSWDAYKQYLSDSLLLKKYRMIAIDRPGFGNSNFGAAADLATQAQVIEDFISQVDNHQPVVLVGHSLGGPVIVKMATDHPDRFPNLVVLAGSVDPRAETPELWRKVLLSKPLRYLIPGALRPSNDELWWLKKDLYDMEPNLKNITARVTIIHGTKDQLVPYRNMAYMDKKFVHAKSIDNISIENANHFIPWEHFDLIRNTLLKLTI